MGIQDYINGEEVKCFYRPLFSKKEVIHNGGSLLELTTGMEVPKATIYRGYGDNFIIVDLAPTKRKANYIIHLITDGRITATFRDKDLLDINSNAFKLTQRNFNIHSNVVIDIYGTELKIKRIEDINVYMQDLNNYKEVINNIRNSSSTNCDEVNIQCEKLKFDFTDKWINTQYVKVKYLGELLDCLDNSLLEDGSITKDSFEIMNSLLELISELGNENILEDYLHWLNKVNASKQIVRVMTGLLDDKFKKSLLNALNKYK